MTTNKVKLEQCRDAVGQEQYTQAYRNVVKKFSFLHHQMQSTVRTIDSPMIESFTIRWYRIVPFQVKRRIKPTFDDWRKRIKLDYDFLRSPIERIDMRDVMFAWVWTWGWTVCSILNGGDLVASCITWSSSNLCDIYIKFGRRLTIVNHCKLIFQKLHYCCVVIEDCSSVTKISSAILALKHVSIANNKFRRVLILAIIFFSIPIRV